MGNIGAEAITLAVIALYQQHCPEARFILSAWLPERFRQVLEGVPGHFQVIPQAVPFDNPLALRRADDFVVCGDVALTESVIRGLPAYWSAKALWARLFGARVVFFGIEAEEPRLWWNRLAIRRVLNPAVSRYLLRNDASYARMGRLGARQRSLLPGCDPTLMVEERLLRLYPAPQLDRSAGELLVGFGIRDHFCGPLELDVARLQLRRRDAPPGELSPAMRQTVAFLAHLADRLIERHGARIVFVPHHALCGGNQVILTDREIAAHVVRAMRHPERTVLLPENLHPYAAMNAYRQFDLVVSMRHHATSFAYRFGVPTVGCAVSEKIETHFRQLGLASLLVDPLATDRRPAEAVLDGAIRDRAALSQRLRAGLRQDQARMRESVAALMRPAARARPASGRTR
jgi:polysaccharide pyruvyl transferase WcaK-like protein